MYLGKRQDFFLIKSLFCICKRLETVIPLSSSWMPSSLSDPSVPWVLERIHWSNLECSVSPNIEGAEDVPSTVTQVEWMESEGFSAPSVTI